MRDAVIDELGDNPLAFPARELCPEVMREHDHVPLPGAERKSLVHQLTHGIERADAVNFEPAIGEHAQPLQVVDWESLSGNTELSGRGGADVFMRSGPNDLLHQPEIGLPLHIDFIQ